MNRVNVCDFQRVQLTAPRPLRHGLAAESKAHIGRTQQKSAYLQRSSRSAVVVRAAVDENQAAVDSFFKDFNLKKLANKVVGAIPVVSLLSKLLTPEGGIGSESLSYNEYCRIKLDDARKGEGDGFGVSLSELCRLQKKEPRQLLLLTWMVYEGNGLINGDIVMACARRMSSSGFDFEYEIFRFENARDEALAAAAKKGVKRVRDTAPAVEAAKLALEKCCGEANGLAAESKAHIDIIAIATMAPL
eukprot:CAMPEP_0197614522 /NCGR_PEP_ID=MMETSP1326-20131121/59568_1 /TAXON_ID=1155430 /ORGANISM="Genus nov. species nov., Strain RCC2288" /LENGTH=245 /DNA_ID=CAMNT_0043183395 /DNA_START=220 /DNA_END=958 /DNA_ORIENTATION=-